MAFGTFENSIDLGEPIQLYLFRYGPEPEHFYAYTNAETPRTMSFDDHADVTFLPVAIDSGEISSSGTLDNQKVAVVFPDALPLYTLFRDRAPSAIVTCIIWRGHANDPDNQYIVEWSGNVTSFNEVNHEIELACDPVATMMMRSALRRRWQYGCAHALYSQGAGLCNANRAAATAPFIVGAVAGNVVTIDMAATVAAYGASQRYDDFGTGKRAFYLGGLMEFIDTDGQKALRRITKLPAAAQFQVSTAIPNLSGGKAVNLVFGCNHKTGIASLNDDGHCGPVHNNIKNFGGQPWIPLKNPLGLHNIYR